MLDYFDEVIPTPSQMRKENEYAFKQYHIQCQPEADSMDVIEKKKKV